MSMLFVGFGFVESFVVVVGVGSETFRPSALGGVEVANSSGEKNKEGPIDI